MPPGAGAGAALCHVLYQHPYQWPVIGWDQDLHHLTLADCRSYYRNHYHPGNITVVIAATPSRSRP